MHMKLTVIDECLTRMQIASKLRNVGVWIISTMKVSRTRNATPPPLPDWRGQWHSEKPGGAISSRYAAVSQEDNQVSVIAIMSTCFDEIRSEREADFWRTDRRLVVAKLMLHDLCGQDYCTDEPGSPPLGIEDWCVQRRRASPQFQLWNLVLDMELAIFNMFRSFFVGNRKMWKVGWTKLPPIASSCHELTKCSCKKGCTRRCTCLCSELACTSLSPTLRVSTVEL